MECNVIADVGLFSYLTVLSLDPSSVPRVLGLDSTQKQIKDFFFQRRCMSACVIQIMKRTRIYTHIYRWTAALIRTTGNIAGKKNKGDVTPTGRRRLVRSWAADVVVGGSDCRPDGDLPRATLICGELFSGGYLLPAATYCFFCVCFSPLRLFVVWITGMVTIDLHVLSV